MSKAFKYAVAYGMLLVDLGLSAWLFIMSRTALLAFLTLSCEPGNFRQLKRAQVIDRIVIRVQSYRKDSPSLVFFRVKVYDKHAWAYRTCSRYRPG